MTPGKGNTTSILNTLPTRLCRILAVDSAEISLTDQEKEITS